MKTVKQWLELDSYGKDKDGKEMGFEEKYYKFIELMGYKKVCRHIPFSREQVEKAIKSGDIHLNTLPLKKWDIAANLLLNGGFNIEFSSSLSDRVCILKQCARIRSGYSFGLIKS